MVDLRIKHLVWDLCRHNRHIRGAEAQKKIDAFLDEEGLSLSSIRQFWLAPEQGLGEFSRLPPEVQQGLSEAAFHHSQEYYLLTNPPLHAAVFKNPLFLLGNSVVRQGWKFKHKGRSSSWLIQGGRFPMRVLRYSARALLQRLRFTRFHSGPALLFLWRYAGVDVPGLIHRYIENIPIDPSLGPVVETAGGKSEVSALLGIDLLLSDGRVFFVEGNVNAGFYENRLRVFPRGDPVCLNLIEYAKTKGYSEIRFNPTDMYGYLFPIQVERSWQRFAERAGISLTIIDDPVNGSPYRRPRGFRVDPREPGVLHVNGRYVEAPLGRMVATKGMLERVVQEFAESSARRVVFSPCEIHSDGELPPISEDDRFPNIIVKNRHLDQAKGIQLFKVNEIPSELNRSSHAIYEYVVPDRVVDRTGESPREFAFVFRAYLLAAPMGPVYLGARKDISRVPLPPYLNEGLVSEPLAYIANATINADSVEPSPQEDAVCRKAVMQVGQAVHEFLKRKHGPYLRS